MGERTELREQERLALNRFVSHPPTEPVERMALAFLIQEITERLTKTGGSAGLPKADRVLVYHAIETLRAQTDLAKARRILRDIHPLLGDLKLTDD